MKIPGQTDFFNNLHTHEGHMDQYEMEYAGFWLRTVAMVIDTVLIILVTLPLLLFIYGEAYWESEALVAGPADVLISWVLPILATLLFWKYRQATPGKMVLSIRILDVETGKPPSMGQLVTRYLAYIVSTLPLLMGFIWVAFDQRKQGLHDKLSNTVVVRRKLVSPPPFDV
jgi:uncharacterized RDD family membrane protein YckC